MVLETPGVGGGGRGRRGDTPLYKPCRYVWPQREAFLRRFDLNLGIDFDHFGLESVVFEGTTRVYERVNSK